MSNTVAKLEDPSIFIHTPARAVSRALQEFERRQNALYRLTWGVDRLDQYLIPMIDGDLVSLLARPGHSKTSTMIHLAKQASASIAQLQEQGQGFNRIVVYVTWETLVEEFIGLLTAQQSGQTLESIARGEADLKLIEKVAVGTISNRIYVIGRSRETPGYHRITLPTVDYILRYLKEQGKEPMLVLLDYVQRIPSPFGENVFVQSKTRIVEENVERAKDIGLDHFCPVVMGVQASRETDVQDGVKFPNMSMAQWSSSIEQTTDKLIALSRPILHLEEGTPVEVSQGVEIPVSPNMLALKVLKQRWGKAGKHFILHFDPSLIKLSDYALDEQEGVPF